MPGQIITPPRVLIVAAMAADAELMRQGFARAGAAITSHWIDSGERLAEALEQFDADIALLCEALPGSGGRAVLRALKALRPGLPVVVVTETADREAAAELLELGARDTVARSDLSRLVPAALSALAVARAEHSTTLLRALVDQTADAIEVLDPETLRFLDCNATACVALGYSREELLALTVFDIDPTAHSLRDRVMQVLQSGRPAVVEGVHRRKDGSSFPVEIHARLLRLDRSYILAVARDISERRDAERRLEEQEVRYKELLEHISDLVVILDAQGIIRYIGPAVERLGGYQAGEVIGRNFIELTHPDDAMLSLQRLGALLRNPEQVIGGELRMRRKNGAWRVVQTVEVNCLSVPGINGIVVTARDVTELKDTARALGQRVKELRCLYLVSSLVGRTDLSEEELLREALAPIVAGLQFPDAAAVRVAVGEQACATPEFRDSPVCLTVELCVDGSAEGRIEACYPQRGYGTGEDAFLDEEREMLQIVADVLGRALSTLRSRARLAASENKYRTLFESSRDALTILWPPDWNYTNVNAAALATFGARDLEELRRLRPWDASPEHQPDGERSETKARRMIDTAMTRGAHNFEWVHRRRDGKDFPASIWLTRIELDGEVGLQASVCDISERQRNERALARVTRALRTLSAGNAAVIRARDEGVLYRGMCEAAVTAGGYRMAWVGIALDDEGKSVRPVAWAGETRDYLSKANISWGGEERGRGPAGNCIRRGEPQIIRHIASDPAMAPWREASQALGYESVVALPLPVNRRVIGALLIYAAEPDAFDRDELKLLNDLAANLSFGIAALRDRAARETDAQRLQQAMESTIDAVAFTVERRDPYTAGHQKRVEKLCAAIAAELGWTPWRIRGLELAASIHDLGKIGIPAEILAKPGKLTASEFSMVQAHAQIGYEILKDIGFPWPIPDMIHQHHERLDGSGYPQGLAGDAILSEARVIAVADVVEAMSSHRPYRAGLGLDVALAQIEAERGSKLDADMVDACVRLFRERDFRLD